jgi:5-methylcytosine-specific restriction endonuclease McrA
MGDTMKRDAQATKLLRANDLLKDRRSYVGYDSEMRPHLKLFGADMMVQRQRVYVHSRGKCAKCRGAITWDSFEMHHKVSRGKSGSDDIANLQAICRDCHTQIHGRYPRFGEGRAEAIKEFEEVMK